MFYNAKNLSVKTGEDITDYIVFGKGTPLVMIPGLGDGLTTVKGKALPMALMYRSFAKKHRVFVFSRKRIIPEHYSTKEMADDLAAAMDAIGIGKTDILGVSQGGMIAQHLAADHPEKVRRLILAVTCPKSNEIMEECISEWISMAEKGDMAAIMESNVRNMYTDKYYKRNGWATGLVAKFTKPKSFSRFITMAHACLEHDASAKLEKISAPCLIIGADGDRTVSPKASEELFHSIPGARLLMYANQRHAVYEEEPDFNKKVLEFLS